MKNRVSKYPGRVLVTPDDGTPPFYATLTRADEPTEQGTPLNKATLLTDETAASYGLGEDATVNDVLAEIDDKHISRPKSKNTATPTGNIPYLSSDRKSLIDYGVSGEYIPTILEEGLTLSFLPSINLPKSVAQATATEGKGKIIVCGYQSGNADYITSDGGKTWREITLPFVHGNSAGVAYDEKLDMFVAIQYQSSAASAPNVNAAAYSQDGINWTAMTLSTARRYCSIAAGNGIFVAGARNFGYAEYSTDGINWKQSANMCVWTSSAECTGISYDDKSGVFVSVSNGNVYAMYSTDGDTWANCGKFADEAKGIACANGIYVALAYNGSTVFVGDSSKQGTTDSWTSKSLPKLTNSETYSGIFYANGMFFAVSNTDVAQTAVSTDGLTWTLLSENIAPYVGVFHDGERFIGVCGGTVIIDSYDGITWLVRGVHRLRLPNGDDVTDTVKTALGVN